MSPLVYIAAVVTAVCTSASFFLLVRAGWLTLGLMGACDRRTFSPQTLHSVWVKGYEWMFWRFWCWDIEDLCDAWLEEFG